MEKEKKKETNEGKNKKENGFISRLKNMINYSTYRLELIELKNKGEITEKEFKRKTSKVWIDSLIMVPAFIIILSVMILVPLILKEKIDEKIEKSKEVVVPNIVGKTISDAEQELSKLELNLKALYPNLYSDSPEAIIQSQKTEVGTIKKKGDTIEVEAKTQEQLDKEEKDRQERERIEQERKEKGYRYCPASTDTIISCAKTLISNQLKAPSTAIWGKSEKVDEDNYGRCLVYVSVEAQNSYGGLVKSDYLVVLQDVETDGHFTYLPYSSIYTIKTFSSLPYSYIEEYKEGNVYPVIQTFLKSNNWNIRPVEK